MADAPNRPTSEVSEVILDSMDRMYDQLLVGLDGLTDDEYLWEPVAATWSVRSHANGPPTVDGANVRDPEPAPVTTIAWRIWHLAMDCLDDYTRRFGGDDRDACADWTMNADEAVRVLHTKWHRYREVVAGRDWWSEPWGPWSRHCVADMAMHASNELVHHGAEIALLRDLYRTTFSHTTQ